MTAADETISEYATRGDLELLRRDLEHTEELLRRDIQLSEERLRSEMHQMQAYLVRWMVGTAIAGIGVGAAVAGAVAAGIALLLT